MFNPRELNDTIAAISTPIGEGGIGIVRLSGKRSLAIADKIFLPKGGGKPSQFKSYSTHFGWIIDSNQKKNNYQLPITNHQIIDEVILTVMRSPKSYTREDIVEINCHSGIVPLKKILSLVLEQGARLAKPGEFTKRAFLAGRIDLTQAEAILDIVRAKTEASLRTSVNQLRGELSAKIQALREEALEVLACLEASIDFPEEDIDVIGSCGIMDRLKNVSGKIKALLATAEEGVILREGLTLVICGRPNVGKSSLLNRLLKQERAIVTAVPGTTRDAIEEVINIDGIPLCIVDTAGILETKDIVSQEGIRKTRDYLMRADLVLFVLDASRPLSAEDKQIAQELGGKVTICAINKSDLKQKFSLKQAKKTLPLVCRDIVKVSALNGQGIEGLKKAISKTVWQGRVVGSNGSLINLRHRDALLRAQQAIKKAIDLLERSGPLELVSVQLRDTVNSLELVTGKRLDEDLLDKIFSRFCIGK
jgi:tRNA modification GTPase